MKWVNINTNYNIERSIFPDGQTHVQVKNVEEGEKVNVVCSLTNSDVVMQLIQCANAIDHLFAKKQHMVIPYFMGARYDRLMQTGDSLDVEVIAGLINSLGFEKVFLLDVHSDASSLLVNRSVNISNKSLVAKYDRPNAVLICPDAGAAKKVQNYFKWNENFVDIIYCSKNRDIDSGLLTLEVLEPEVCKGRNCIIVDDICDTGNTFIQIAKEIEPGHLTLMVSHGIFSKGLDTLRQYFDEIITTNSFTDISDPLVKTYAALEMMNIEMKEV